MPIYNNSRRLDTALKNLENVDITDKNKQDIKDFLHYIASYGVSIGRQCKYIYPLEYIARWIGKDFITATKEDIQVLVEYIDTVKKGDDEPHGISKVKRYIDENKGNNREPKYTDWTRMDYKIIIKKFWKWLHNRHIDDEEDWETPKIVKFIKPKKPRNSKKIQADLITPKDVEILISYCKSLKEKGLILTLYESGARIGELLNLKIKDAVFDDLGVKLNIHNKVKTKDSVRVIRLVGSAPALTQWLSQEHPTKNDRNSFLFCNINRGKEGTQFSYASVKKMLRTIKEKSGFEKPINPHHFRHSRATELAEFLTDAQRCSYLGWEQGSDMARIYTHMADTDRVILEMNGLVKKKKDNGKFASIVCPRCGTNNPYGTKECFKCFLSLQSEEAKEEVTIRRQLILMQKQHESFQKMIEEEIMPKFWGMKQKLDRIDQEESDIEIKEQWTKEAYEHFAEQEKLH